MAVYARFLVVDEYGQSLECAMAYYSLEKLINLDDGYRKTFLIEGRPLLLMQEEGEIYLIENYCPHQGRPLETASVSHGLLRCPYHRFQFDLKTGVNTEYIGLQCRALKRYPIVYEGDTVGFVMAGEW